MFMPKAELTSPAIDADFLFCFQVIG